MHTSLMIADKIKRLNDENIERVETVWKTGSDLVIVWESDEFKNMS